MASKRIWLDLPYTSSLPDAYRHSSDAIRGKSGANFGNDLFRHALKGILADIGSFELRLTGELVRAPEAEIVILSCANWIGASERHEKANGNRLQALQRTSAALVPFGLGAQAPLGATELELGPSTTALVRLMSERSRTISVRDAFTARVLEAVGVNNVLVTGCPSNFINKNAGLGREICEKAKLDRNPRTIISEAQPGTRDTAAMLDYSVAYAQEYPVFYLLQSPMCLSWLFGEVNSVPPTYAPYADFLRRHALHFSGSEAWLDFARTCGLAFGMRIHGTIAPLQAGVPSILVQHDSRTSGLASTLGIPSVSPEELVASSRAELCERIAQTMEGYDQRRGELAEVMKRHVEANGLQLHDDFTSAFG